MTKSPHFILLRIGIPLVLAGKAEAAKLRDLFGRENLPVRGDEYGGDAVLFAVRAAFVRAHDKECSSQRVRSGGILVDDRDAAQAGRGRITGFRVEDMMIAHAVLLKITLVVARGDDRQIVHRDRRDRVGRLIRVRDADVPVLPLVRADGVNIAAQHEQSVRIRVLQNVRAQVGRIALRDAAEVDPRAAVQLHAVAADVNVLRADGLKRSINVALRRYLLMLGADAPEVGQWRDRRVVCAVCRGAELERRTQQLRALVRQRDRRAVRRVQLRDVGIPARARQHAFERVDLVLALLCEAFAVRAEHLDRHKGIHGKKIGGIRLTFAAAAGKREQQKGRRKNSFHSNLLKKFYFSIHYNTYRAIRQDIVRLSRGKP